MEELSGNPMFNITFFSGIIFIFSGVAMLFFPPKTINSFYGYRTSSSMKNIERWRYAQKFSSVELLKLGLILSLCSIFAIITNFSKSVNLIIGLILVISAVAILFIRVEIAIKNKFK